MGNLTAEGFAMALTSYIVLLFSLSVHESAHAWMALRMGDDTAQRLGRISLNPIVHMDPIGTVLMPLLMFFSSGVPFLAWAKPTPYNPANFRPDRTVGQGHMLVASAGPVSNMVLVVVFTIALAAAVRLGVPPTLHDPIFSLLRIGIILNISLAIFNLLPLPPLDGSKVASWGLPRSIAEPYDRVMEPYGGMILLVLLLTGVLGRIMMPLVDLALALVRAVVH